MDKLKEYLLHHKADLDVDSPPGDTWEKIGSKMTRSGFSTWVVRCAVAACVIALAGTALWLIVKNNNKLPSAVAKHSNETIKSEPAPGKEKTTGNTIARNTSKPKQTRHKVRSQKPAEPSDEIAIIDKSYSSLIDYQLRKLRTTPLYAENGNYFSFYVEQFKQTDQDEQQVRNDIKTYGLTSEFLEQLINVYQQKLNVLKNLQTEINKMNNKVRGKQGPSEKAEVHYLNI